MDLPRLEKGSEKLVGHRIEPEGKGKVSQSADRRDTLPETRVFETLVGLRHSPRSAIASVIGLLRISPGLIGLPLGRGDCEFA